MLPSPSKLPVHGFVLIGGRSSRMGRDKALLEFLGAPLVEIAVAKLHTFCSAVSLAGNRDDLQHYAPVAREQHIDFGPGAGMLAGLSAAASPWAMFLPVDAPLVPAGLLRRWAEACLSRPGCRVSFLRACRAPHPAFALLHSSCAASLHSALTRGERKLETLLHACAGANLAALWEADAEAFAPSGTADQMAFWFSNLNTPEELAAAEARAEAEDWSPKAI